MKDKKRLLADLDAAIDTMDMDGIEQNLEALSAVSQPVAAEDPVLFSARIQKTHKEKTNMKTSRKPLKIAVAAAVAAVLSISVYAASTMNLFSFGSGDKFTTLRTTENMTEEEAKQFVADDDVDISDIPEDMIASPDIETYEFDTVDEAIKTLDMKVPLPAALPEMELESASAQTADFDSSKSRSLWLNYTDEDGRMFGVTITREIIDEGADVTMYTKSDMDPGSLGSYTSKTGVTYQTLTESDDSGEKTAHIATTSIGEYEYALVFFGFDDTERQQIIDSTDLSSLR